MSISTAIVSLLFLSVGWGISLSQAVPYLVLNVVNKLGNGIGVLSPVIVVQL